VGDRVRLIGFVSAEELPTWYQAAHALLLPTRAIKCFGLPVIEAKACGCIPLIVPEVVPPELVRDPRFVASANSDSAFADLPGGLAFAERLNRVRP
jgi:glycosyltransferase involved in cell wall biosynthesis